MGAQVQMGPDAHLEMRQQEDGMVQLWLDPDIPDHPNVPKGAQFLCLSTLEQCIWIGQTLAVAHGLRFDALESPQGRDSAQQGG